MENNIGSFAINLEVELQNAAVARGISPKELAEMPGIQLWLEHENDMCKADLIVWFRLRNQLEAVSSDLQKKHIEKLQRQAKIRRGK